MQPLVRGDGPDHLDGLVRGFEGDASAVGDARGPLIVMVGL